MDEELDPLTVEEQIDALATPGLLTERQATAFVLREIEATPNWAVADSMDLSPSYVSELVTEATRKLQAAEETLDALERSRWQSDKPPGDFQK